MKERINQFWRELSFIFWDDERHPIAKKITLPQSAYHLPDGQIVTLQLSNMNITQEMEAVEYEAYHQVRSWKASDFQYDMTQNFNSFYLQAFIEDRLIGFIGCRCDSQDVHISNFVIHPDFQSQGIGAFLMQQIIAILPQINRQRISLEVRINNEGAQRFYERFGFKKGQIKRNYYIDNQEDAIVMYLAIS